MSTPPTLRQWIVRARPTPRALAIALAAGALAALANLGLLIGAVGLLFDSSSQPGLRAVAVALVVIELVAFSRSPLRFGERLSAHRLGYAAVTRWRMWLVRNFASLSYARWRNFAAGDVLERSLADTDELQVLWLRGVLPLASTCIVLAAGDIVIGFFPPHFAWWIVSINLATIQLMTVGLLALVARRELRADRRVRATRARWRAELVELERTTPHLSLLGRVDVAQARLNDVASQLDHHESRLRRWGLVSSVVITIASTATVLTLVSRPPAATLWTVVVAAYCLANAESFVALRLAMSTFATVAGAAERLDALSVTTTRPNATWPTGTHLRVRGLFLNDVSDGRTRNLSFDVHRGSHVAVTGSSGAGKSTLLRTVAGIDEAEPGTVTVGDCDLDSFSDVELRRHLTYLSHDPGFARGYALDIVTLGQGPFDAAEPMLRRLNLPLEADDWCENLSRGELSRVGIVRTLLPSPDFVVLDEPTSGLGEDDTRRVLQLLDERGVGVLVATHDPMVINWCDVVIDLDQYAGTTR